jgi:enoyl-CoA hydratase
MANNWFRSQSGTFEASLAYEFYGFGGEDAAAGVAKHRERSSQRARSRPS